MNTLLNSGDTLISRYRVLHHLGNRGFGHIYLAEDINRFNKHYVLKEFVPQIQDPFALEKAQALFEQEAGILYRLQHPQIPKFRELFRYKHEDKGRLLLVEDYVEGETYRTLCKNRVQAGSRFREAEVNQLLCQLLPVLEYIHSMELIHCDISPDSLILRSADNLTTLTDFGLIKEVENKLYSQFIEATSTTATQSGCNSVQPRCSSVIGQPGYTPPEQMEQGTTFAQSDLYALAGTAIVLLTGKEPQQFIDPKTHRWNWQGEIMLSPKLEWILTTMLSPNPRDRFISATEVNNALQENSSLPPIRQTTETAVPVGQSGNRQPITRKKGILPGIASKALFLAPLAAAVVLIGNYGGWKDQEFALFSPPVADSHNSAQRESQLSQRFSLGEKVLISQTTTPEKESAAAAFANNLYHKAGSLFSESLNAHGNDPEALIYPNNARIGEQKSYAIAVSVPIGSDVNAAQEILRGVAHVQNLVNQADGIDGIPLKIQIVNDDNDPEIAKQVATILSQNPDILGVVGHYASDVTLATANIYQAGHLVAISPISTSVKISNLSPYLFRTVPSDYIAARALAAHMLEGLKQKKVAIFYNSQSNYSVSLKSEFSAAVSLGGGQIVNEFDLSDTNFNAADSFNQAMQGGAEVLMLAANTGALDRALQVVQVNRQRLSLLGGDDVYTPKTLQIVGELAEGMVLAIPWHIKSNPDSEFVQVSKQLWGGEVNWRTAMAYDAASALIAAIDRRPTRIGVQQALSNPNFSTPGANSPINFVPSGDRLKEIELVTITPSDRNSFGYEFEPILPPAAIAE